MFSQIDKQIARNWRKLQIDDRILELIGRKSQRKGPRIAVIGNCQSYGVAYAIKVMHPTATVDHYSAIGKTLLDVEVFARTLQTYDHVFSHEFPGGHVKGGSYEDVLRLVPKTILYPALVFPAFHPDQIYLLDETSNYRPLDSAVGPYHSALAVFAYHKGLSTREANALFNRNVYEAVGYFNVWDDAVREFLTPAKERCKLDFSNEVVNWARRGPFMFSTVHPRPFVMHDIARKILPLAGLEAPEVPFDHFSIDDLARSEVFPVYPPIAESFGARGSYLFKLANFHLSAGVGEFITLPEYIERCYAIYRRATPAQLRHTRVDGWLSSDSTTQMLVNFARENSSAGATPVA